MAVDMAARYRLQDVEQATESAPDAHAAPRRGPYLAVTVFDGDQWASICRELDVASAGRTADEAIANVVDAVREYLQAAREQGGDARTERRVPDPEMRDFLLAHHGPDPISYVSFVLWPDRS
ncbi:MAG: type II toxin-antitoxin system HicB family antitoxin [Candidatus Dormibacteraceae bacterium]